MPSAFLFTCYIRSTSWSFAFSNQWLHPSYLFYLTHTTLKYVTLHTKGRKKERKKRFSTHLFECVSMIISDSDKIWFFHPKHFIHHEQFPSTTNSLYNLSVQKEYGKCPKVWFTHSVLLLLHMCPGFGTQKQSIPLTYEHQLTHTFRDTTTTDSHTFSCIPSLYCYIMF